MTRPAHHITRSRLQLEASIRTLLRNCYAQGCTDDEALDFTVGAMGKEHGPLVARVLAREFKATQPI
jgi:hypothetical protein